MRKITILVAAMAVLALSATAAFAHHRTLSVNITSPTSGAELTVTSSEYPLVVPIAGNLSTDSADLDNVTLTVEVNGENEFSRNGFGDGVQNTNWGFDYDVLEEGVYNIRAFATQNNQEDRAGHTADDESHFEVVEVEETTLIVARPAAPAIAGKLLAENNVNHKYGSGKNSGNHIADVAKEMGPGTDFQGVSKRDPGYEAKIDAFLSEKGAY